MVSRGIYSIIFAIITPVSPNLASLFLPCCPGSMNTNNLHETATLSVGVAKESRKSYKRKKLRAAPHHCQKRHAERRPIRILYLGSHATRVSLDSKATSKLLQSVTPKLLKSNLTSIQ